MRVLFVSVSVGLFHPPSFEAGIGSIAAVLKKHRYSVDLFCFNSWNNISGLEKRVIEFEPDVIAFSSTTSTFKAVTRISKILKKKFPTIRLICGGIHITLNPEDFYEAPSLDAICLGEGEYSFLEFLEKLKKKRNYSSIEGFWVRKNKKIIKNPAREIIKDLDQLPFPDRDIFLKEGSLWFPGDAFGKPGEKGLEFIFSRGCPFDCTFCSNRALREFCGSNYVRFRSPSKAIEEIGHVMKGYRFDFFHFHDDIFTLNETWLDSFLEKYKEIRVPFNCNIRVGSCTKDILKKLKRAGCECILFGLESGDFHLRKNVLNRAMTDEQIINTCRWAKEVGLKIVPSIMMGLPEETPCKFLKTVRLVSKVKPDNYTLYIFHPYPGTGLFKVCKEKKLFRKKINKDFIERRDTVLNIPTFPREDILYFYKHFPSLLSLSQKRKDLIKEIHRRILFFLLSKPPSSQLYLISRALFGADRAFSSFLRSILKPT